VSAELGDLFLTDLPWIRRIGNTILPLIGVPSQRNLIAIAPVVMQIVPPPITAPFVPARTVPEVARRATGTE
jgi:hypothetical protein